VRVYGTIRNTLRSFHKAGWLAGRLKDGWTYIYANPSDIQKNTQQKLSTNLLPLFHRLLYVFFVLLAFSPARQFKDKGMKK